MTASISRSPDHGTMREEAKVSLLSVWLVVLRNCLWATFGSLVFVLSIGAFGASVVLVGVLREIGEKNFSGPMEQINSYEDLFSAVSAAGGQVQRDNPSLHEGVTTYLWTASAPDSDEIAVFRWQHDFKTNVVSPMTGPAILTDVALGYMSRGEARELALFDPSDELTKSILRLGLGLADGEKAAAKILPEAPEVAPAPLPPLVDPKEGRNRNDVAPLEEENPCADAVPGEETPPGDSTEVSPPGEEGDPVDGNAENGEADEPGTPDEGGESEDEKKDEGGDAVPVK